MTTEATVRTFFSSPNFAVVGASSNPAKYGHKVFAWYTAHSLPATPINPTTPEISVSGAAHKTVPSLSALPHPKQTSVSIITPPKATLSVLREAKELGIPAVWMQPGSFDDEVLAFARSAEAGFKGVVAGDGGRGSEGWCILVDGERGLKAAGKL
ncbi:NAD(P)-binding protein [Coniochaeta ligniaria NRRL 30616]|uniref:NAD(P)-binding protein n=1 Tax=Coniochaeta ligniaria NRRL 30616 TaxID=1408157 RepID=A0A1J7IL08_9PEZI|nr:NAD(P)-binding protein [Coniochaeta ligniaria NRRL 30616]